MKLNNICNQKKCVWFFSIDLNNNYIDLCSNLLLLLVVNWVQQIFFLIRINVYNFNNATIFAKGKYTDKSNFIAIRTERNWKARNSERKKTEDVSDA